MTSNSLRQQTIFNALFQGEIAIPYLILHIRRDHIVEDALNQLSVQGTRDLKKKLKIVFAGEEGIDEGGLTKEFFQLIVKELFDPKYGSSSSDFDPNLLGMFTYDEESRLYWFNSNSIDTEQEFALIGIVLGLAIYNGVILNIYFPQVVYKKLLGYKPTLADLKEAQPVNFAKTVFTL